MIRLVHLVPWLAVGGAEGVILDLCRFRDRAGFDCTVACAHEPVSVIAEEIRACGVPVVTGPAACRAAAVRADLVNIHWWAYDPPYFALAAKRPRVTTLHWQQVAPRLDAVTICTSDYLRRLQPDPSGFVAIPNGIDVERFRTAERPRRDAVVITRVCRPSKCAPYFWEAAHRILARYPQVEIRIVGNETAGQHPSPRVRFLGVRRDIPQILAESDLFLYTPYPEIGSKDLVVMEASAAGLPAVLSDVSVVKESVEEGVNGFLTRYADVEAVVERLSQLIEDEDLRRRMSHRAVELARERFDVRQVARRYESVYRAVLAAHREHRGTSRCA